MTEDYFPKHPLQKYIHTQWPIIGLAVMIAIFLVLKFLDTTPSIVAFEFAYDFSTAESMMAAWGEDGKTNARWSIYIDFIFLVVYSSTIALFLLRAASRFEANSMWSNAGKLIAWGQWDAALFDIVENVMMLLTINGASSWVNPWVAYWCAVFKFLFLGIGVLYLIAAWLKMR